MSKKRFKFSLLALGTLAAFFLALIALFLAPTFASADKSTANEHHNSDDHHQGTGSAPNPVYFEHSNWNGSDGGHASGGGLCVGASCGGDKPGVQNFDGDDAAGDSGQSGSGNGSDNGSGNGSGQIPQGNGFGPNFFAGGFSGGGYGGSSGGGNGGSSGGGNGGPSGGGDGGPSGQPDGSGQANPDFGNKGPDGLKGPDDKGPNVPGPQIQNPDSPPPDLPPPFEHHDPIEGGGPPPSGPDSPTGLPDGGTHKVPEPLTMSLFAVGLAGCAGMRRRRKGQ